MCLVRVQELHTSLQAELLSHKACSHIYNFDLECLLFLKGIEP